MSTLQIIQSHMDQLLHGSVRDTLQVGSSLIPIHQAGNRTGLSDTSFPLSWLCQLMTGQGFVTTTSVRADFRPLPATVRMEVPAVGVLSTTTTSLPWKLFMVGRVKGSSEVASPLQHELK